MYAELLIELVGSLPCGELPQAVMDKRTVFDKKHLETLSAMRSELQIDSIDKSIFDTFKQFFHLRSSAKHS
jgi:hypothetical protein